MKLLTIYPVMAAVCYGSIDYGKSVHSNVTVRMHDISKELVWSEQRLRVISTLIDERGISKFAARKVPLNDGMEDILGFLLDLQRKAYPESVSDDELLDFIETTFRYQMNNRPIVQIVGCLNNLLDLERLSLKQLKNEFNKEHLELSGAASVIAEREKARRQLQSANSRLALVEDKLSTGEYENSEELKKLLDTRDELRRNIKGLKSLKRSSA